MLVIVVSFLLYGGAGGPSRLPSALRKPPTDASYTLVQGDGAFIMCQHMLHQSWSISRSAIRAHTRTLTGIWGPGPPFVFTIDSSLPLPRIKTSVCTTPVSMAGARHPGPGQTGREASLMKGSRCWIGHPAPRPWMRPPATRDSARERVSDRGSG